MLKIFLFACFTVNLLVGSIPLLDESVIEGRIIGGNETDITKVPYIIAEFEHNTYMCGGFIVNPTHVVTAAQCLDGAYPSQVFIRAGSSSNQEGGVVIKAQHLFIHPKFHPSVRDYDIGVIELATPLKLNDKTIKAVKLATKEPKAGSVVTVSGWGFIGENLERPKVLQSMTIPIHDRADCTKGFKAEGVTITQRMICAYAKGKRAVFGDVGSPVIYNGEVVGMVAFGVGEFPRELPGVYTNIADPDIIKYIKEMAKM